MLNYSIANPICVTSDDEDATFTLVDDDTLLTTCTGDLSCTCAWCLQEQGIAPSSDDSHGICTAHAAAIYTAWKAGRA